jgi:serine/threonine protein kinase
LDVDARKFQEEAETTEQLVHPHIVRLLDFDLEQGTPFLVLDFAPGGSLRTRHPKGSVVPLATVESYLNELVPALQYAHDKHILHRDIKPDNMLIGRQDELLLSDFGIAMLTQTGRTSLSSAYGIGGTPYYMAPETYRGRPEKASDQYALAVVVYEWLCGSVPFSQGDFIQLGFQHAHEPVPPLREQNPAIPPDVEQVVMTALAKDPRQRFGSMLAFATALKQASQVTQREAEPIIPISETTETNQSQQPTEMATPVPIIPLSQQTVGEVSADILPHPQTLIPSSGKERLTQAEEARLQEKEQSDKIEEEQAPKVKEAGATQQTEEERAHTDQEEEQARKAEAERVPKVRQEPTPSRFPPSAGTRIPQGLRLRFLSWKGATLLLVLALLILGSGVGLYAAMRISSARTQAIAQAYATATAQVVATATTAERMYANATSGAPVIDDPLVDNSRGYHWTVGTLIVNATNIGTCTFSGGAYHIIPFKGYWIFCGPSGSFSDFAFQVQMKIITGDTGGISFRITNLNGGYEFYITPEGSYTLFSHHPDPRSPTSTTLLHGSSSAIRTGLNQSNLIAVLAQGNIITLYVNSRYIGRVVDNTYNRGYVGASASAFFNPTEVLYSNAKVWTFP